MKKNLKKPYFLVDGRQQDTIMLYMIIEEIRKRIKSSDKTMRQISEKTGVDKAALCRIKNGGSCKVETAEILLKYFGFTITKKPKRKAR